uniref:Uncharacterized protein n=1 Tax=Mycena chlorophos TaxID=658473 RepID=A0ABQ0LZJ8_MYCCL|nr:predicted protein [Mycena chlorophos]
MTGPLGCKHSMNVRTAPPAPPLQTIPRLCRHVQTAPPRSDGGIAVRRFSVMLALVRRFQKTRITVALQSYDWRMVEGPFLRFPVRGRRIRYRSCDGQRRLSLARLVRGGSRDGRGRDTVVQLATDRMCCVSWARMRCSTSFAGFQYVHLASPHSQSGMLPHTRYPTVVHAYRALAA